jgi:hypothetical protein
MPTTGLYGFQYKGNYYVQYYGTDSYPAGLGACLIKDIKIAMDNGQFAQWRDSVGKIKSVKAADCPSDEEVKHILQFSKYSCPLFVYSSQRLQNWRSLTHGCVDSLSKIIDSGYVINQVDERGKPMFEQYTYIVNFDTDEFDFYWEDERIRSYKLDQLPEWTKETTLGSIREQK